MFCLFLLALQELFHQEAFLGCDTEIKVEQLEKTPFDAGSNIAEDLIVHILAIFGEDVP